MAANVNRQFAKHLRKLRRKRRLTQERLAELAGIEYKHLQALESAKPPSPRLETIEKLAQALKMPRLKLLDF